MPVSLKRVPLIKEGQWPVGRSDGHQGPTPITADELRVAVDHFKSGRYPQPVGGLAHVPGAGPVNGHSGLPSLGLVTAAEVAPDETGRQTLYVDMDDVPEWVARNYPRRSGEWWKTSDGQLIVHKVGFMADDYPAIDQNMDYAARMELAEAMTTDEGPAPALIAAGAVLCAAAFDTTSPLGAEQPSPTGPDNNEQEEPGMSLDPKLVARSLGLPEDTPVDEINEAAEKRAAEIVAEAEKVTETEAVIETEQPTVEAPAVEVTASSAETVTVEKSVWEATVAKADKGEQAFATLARQEAERVVAAAVADEKIPDDAKVVAGYVADLTVKGDTTAQHTMTLLTAAADQGGFVKGRTSIPTGGHAGHSVTAAASGQSEADRIYSAVYGEEG
jgi:hypothetical protein